MPGSANTNVKARPHARPLYVEVTIDAPLDRIWELTQSPHLHQRWDARFSRIAYGDVEADANANAGDNDSHGTTGAVRFHYRLGVGPVGGRGPALTGNGITTAERRRADGARISALRFASDSRWSPLQEGTGYWRYVPEAGQVRFLTGYDYRTWPGRSAGRLDRYVIRPWVGWLTAWSFDRLRLWAELGITPERSRRNAWFDATARTAAVLAVAAVAGLLPALGTALMVSLLPPLPTTPAARRCVRKPPDPKSARPPGALARLARP
ncbi:hypothetical protein [Kitasatospora sp. NPDC002040]|uniref:hypothetical protein n=1 Tax=Kitasatospora sp. NPDC002040 TaxID=3154661 RepID=UPI003319721C